MDSQAPLASTGSMMPAQMADGRERSTNEPGCTGGRPDGIHRETRVVVHREWNGWRTAIVTLTDLQDVRWLQPNGAPRALIHACVSCSKLLSGDLQHDCDQASAPHRLLVCVLKRHAASDVFEKLARLASKAGTRQTAGRSVSIAFEERETDVLATTEGERDVLAATAHTQGPAMATEPAVPFGGV